MPVIISRWSNIKPVADKVLEEILFANTELQVYIKDRTPLSNRAYGHLGEFKRMNLMMSP